MRERITITLRKDILDKIDNLVGEELRNRSHAVERLLLKALNAESLDTIVLLAAGRGVRLRPSTYEIPKAMMPIKEKPVLEHQINLFKNYGITNFVVVVGHLKDKIKNYFGNGSKFGVNIEYLDVDIDSIGTAGVLQILKPKLKKRFAVQNADTLMNPNISEIIDFHIEHGSLGTIMLVSSDEPQQSGVVKVEGTKIINFEEKPEVPQSNIINGGLYIFEHDFLNYLPKDLSQYIESVLSELAKKGLLSGYISKTKIYDMGTPERYEKAIKEWNFS